MDQSDSVPRTKGHTIRRWIADKAGMLLVLVAGATLAAYLGRFHHLTDLATNFRVQYLAAAAVLTALLLLLRSWRWAVFGAVVVALNLGPILPYYWPHESPTAAPNLRVLVANVLTVNSRYDGLLTLIRNQRPDLVALVEVDQKWMRAMSTHMEDYPYKVSQPRGDNFGIAVFSKIPFTNERIFELAESQVPTISIQLTIAGRPATFLTVHTLPPGSAAMARTRDAQLRAVAEIARHESNPVILCGDFNATPWSPIFKDTLTQSGLKDARLGFGIQGTWPVQYSPCLIPLDHCLVTPEIAVHSFHTNPPIGSDHLPITIDLLIPPPAHLPPKTSNVELRSVS